MPCCLQINEACNIKKKYLYRAYVNIPAIRNNHLQHNATIMFLYIYIIYIYIYICFLLYFTCIYKNKNTWVVHLRTQNINIFTRTSSHHSTNPFQYKILTRTVGENKNVLNHIFCLRFILRNDSKIQLQ